MDFTKDELALIYQYDMGSKADTVRELKMIIPCLKKNPYQLDIVESTIKKLSAMPDDVCRKFMRVNRERFIVERDRSIEERQARAKQEKSKNMQRGKTIGELLDEARRDSGAECLAGHDILDLMRFAPDTRHMVVFVAISEEAMVGVVGEKTRAFLTVQGYENMLNKQRRGHIKILNHATVYNGRLYYDQTDHDL